MSSTTRVLGATSPLLRALVIIVALAFAGLHGSSPFAQAPAPTVTSVSPSSGYNYKTTSITIGGSDFVATPTVTLGTVALSNVVFVNGATLTATVPAELPAGAYALTVRNPDGQTGTLTGAFTVQRSDDGTIEGWASMSPMIYSRHSHGLAVSGRFVYAIGGYGKATIPGYSPTFQTTLASVEYTSVNADGTLNAWQTTSQTFNEKTDAAAITWGENIYVIGGDNKIASGAGETLASVERAHINADGSLGPWQATSSLNSIRSGHAAVAFNRYVYAIGGGSDSIPKSMEIERAAVNSDGSLSPWTVVSSLPEYRPHIGCVIVNGFIYVVGGSDPPLVASRKVFRAAINADGTLGPWAADASLLRGHVDPIVVAFRGVLYVTSSSAQPEAAVINANGSLAAWQIAGIGGGFAQEAQGFGLDGNVFATGGVSVGDSFVIVAETVRRASLSPPSLTSVSPSAVSVPATVTLAGANFVPGATIQLGTGSPIATTFVSGTQVTASIPGSIAQGSYSVTLTNGDGRVASGTPTLVVDNTSPSGTAVINSNASTTASRSVTLTLSAADDLSGVAEMAFSNDGGAFPAYEPFSTSKNWVLTDADGTRTVSARFRDRAGNVSAVVSDSIVLNRTPPSGSLAINGSAVSTISPNVTLVISATAATSASTVSSMSFSTDGTTWGAWETYATSKAWTLAGSDGIKTLYARFQDSAGNVSSAVTDSIALETTIANDSISVNAGALYTNTTAVTLTLGARPNASEMLLSNDGGFAGATWEPYAAHRAWTITSLGSNVIPRVVYARFRDVAGAVTPTVQDDIILDTTAPNGSVATSGSGSTVTLLMSANDDLSGVESMAVSGTSTFTLTAWEPFAASKPWSVAGGGVYAKFRDRAGNVSPVVTPQGAAPPTAPFGVIDTPANGAVVSGSIAITGWALDEVRVTRVRIYRDPVSGESPDVQIYIGDAVLVDGARSDVEAAYPTLPFARRAGWGYLLLTNMLPNKGNGAVTLLVYADDADGNTTLLGARTIVPANATATAPFGAIDTPGQGATVSGTAYLNFGWALTPQPNAISTDGSTITVYIDGQPVGKPVYNNFRSDVASLFPGLANTNGAVGYLSIDTTRYLDGIHTIAWVAIDNAGGAAGIGSRYFTVQNTLVGLRAAETAARPGPMTAVHAEGVPQTHRSSAVEARIGYDEDAPWHAISRNDDGAFHVHAAVLTRVQVRFEGSVHDASLVGLDGRRPLPIGSSFDPKTGLFTWQPGPGFTGRYDLVFVGTATEGSAIEIPIVVTLDPR